MHQLNELLKKRLNQHQLGASAAAAELVFRAGQLLKEWFPESQEAVKPAYLKQDILWIEVESSAWSQEVWGVSERLLTSLQSEFGEKMLKKVRTKHLTSL